MTRPPGVLLAVLAGLTLVLTFFALQGVAPEPARHERTLEALRTLTLRDAALQRDVLQARAGMLASYDPIVAAMGDLRAAAAALQDAGAEAPASTRAGLDRRVAEVAGAVAAQEARVDAFKSQYALLRNSLAYFSHLIADISGASDLANAMLRFTRGEGPVAMPDVVAELDRLSEPGGPNSGALVAHGRLIVATLPRVDGLVGEIVAAPIARRTEAVQEAYLRYHGQATGRADRFRTLLYVAALVLVGYLGYLVLRLRASAISLRSRVALESLIASISTTFIDQPRERIADGIDAAIARLGARVGVDRATIVIAGAADVERAHAWRRKASGRALPPEDILALARTWPFDGTQGEINVPRVPGLPDGRERSQLQRAGIGTWLCIRVERTEDRVVLLALELGPSADMA